jgi:hypothetical protein
MTPNQKLTKTLAGKTIADVHPTDGKAVTIRFGDGATMTVQGALASTPTNAPAGHVKMVRESGASLAVELDSGATLQFTLADPGGSVLVRDAHDAVAYAG